MIIIKRVIGFDSSSGRIYPAHAIRLLPNASYPEACEYSDIFYLQARIKTKKPTSNESFDVATIYAFDEEDPNHEEFVFRSYNLHDYPIPLTYEDKMKGEFRAIDTGIRAEFFPAEIFNVEVAEEWKQFNW